MFWRRKSEQNSKQAHDDGISEGWNSCLDAVEKFLGEHQWVTDEDDPKEILCDGCGASLSRKLRTMRRESAVSRKGRP